MGALFQAPDAAYGPSQAHEPWPSWCVAGSLDGQRKQILNPKRQPFTKKKKNVGARSVPRLM